MADPNYSAMPDEDQALVLETMQLFSQMQTWRNVFAGQWEEVAALILPTSRNTFFYGSFNWPGQKMSEQQVDSTGMVALHRFAAILRQPPDAAEHGVARAEVRERRHHEGPAGAALVRASDPHAV
jgi:hypothetical protein